MTGWRILLSRRWLGYLAFAVAFAIACAFLSSWQLSRGKEAVAESAVHNQLEQWEKAGYGHLPVCIAKTQYSFSTDPELRGAPSGHVVPVREVRLAAGAGFIVAICGKITTMPGLPRSPAAERIFLNDQGEIEGLF